MQTSSKVYQDNWLDLQKGNIILISTIKPKHCHCHHKPCKPCEPCKPIKPCVPCPPPMHHEPCPPCDPCPPCHPHHEPCPPCDPHHHHHPLPPMEPTDIDGDGWTEDVILFANSNPKKEAQPVIINDSDIDIEEAFAEEPSMEYSANEPEETEPEEMIFEAPMDSVWETPATIEEPEEEPLAAIEPVEEVVEEAPKRRINRGGRRKSTK